MATLLAALPGDVEAVPKSVRPVSNAAFAVSKVRAMLVIPCQCRSVHHCIVRPADLPCMPKLFTSQFARTRFPHFNGSKHDGAQGEHKKVVVHEEHSKHGKGRKHGKCKGKGKGKGGKVHGKHHWKHHGGWNNDDDDDHHGHGHGHGKGHGKHWKHWKHHNFSVKDMVRHVRRFPLCLLPAKNFCWSCIVERCLCRLQVFPSTMLLCIGDAAYFNPRQKLCWCAGCARAAQGRAQGGQARRFLPAGTCQLQNLRECTCCENSPGVWCNVVRGSCNVALHASPRLMSHRAGQCLVFDACAAEQRHLTARQGPR